MKRSIFTLFLTVCLFALCALPAFAEEAMPSFEERKEMAIEAAVPYAKSSAAEQGIEWNLEGLTAEAYPCYGILSVSSKNPITADEIAEHSMDMAMLFYLDNQPLMMAFTRYTPETGGTEFLMYGYDGENVQEFASQVDVFNQIKTEDSPISIISGFRVNYVYGDTVYGDRMLMEVEPYADDLDASYFQSMDTDGYPLIYAEDFEYMVEQMLVSDKMGGSPTRYLPQYNHAMIVRNRWIFGTAGVLLLVGFIAYRVYRAKQQAKAE